MLRHSLIACGVSVVLIAAAWAQPGGAPGALPSGFPVGPPPGGGFGGSQPPQPGQVLPASVQDQLKLSAEQKKGVVEVQKAVDAGLEKLLSDVQKKRWKDLKDPRGRSPGPGGPGGPGPNGFPGGPGGIGMQQPGGPAPVGQIMSAPLQGQLQLTSDQKKELAALQKDTDTRLDKLLTDPQRKQFQEIKENPFRLAFGPGPGGPGGLGGFGPGPGPGGPGGPGGFGPGFNPGAFGQPRLDDVKRMIAATDEEWKVIGPKLQKVINTRQAVNGEQRGFGGPFGGGGSPVTQAQAELKAVLDDPKHTTTDVAEKIAAVRKARAKARADFSAAQKDLLDMLTAAQEAALISLGYLE
jgi:hypothetical protein